MSTVTAAPTREDHRVFLRPRQPMFWVYCGLMVVAGFPTVLVFGPYIATTPTVFAVTVLVNGALAFGFIRLINRIDLFEREPAAMLSAAFAWGGVGAVGFAMHTNDAMGVIVAKLGASDWDAALTAPIDEELIKGVGVVMIVVICRRYIDRPMDGLIVGMMCGLGFEVVENVLYGVQTAVADVNDDLGAGITVTLVRLLFGLGSHVMYTGIVGLGIGYAATRTDRPVALRALAVLGTLALAWLFHFLWDAPVASSFVLIAAKYLLLVVAFYLLYRYAARREWDWFTTAMASQPPAVITETELASMRTLRGRHQARRAAGKAAKRRTRHLQDAQLAYAIALDRDGETDPETLARRDELLALRDG